MSRWRPYRSCADRFAWFSALVVLVSALTWPRSAHAGYTHYWRWKKEPATEEVDRAVAEMLRLALARASILEIDTTRDGSPALQSFGDGGTSFRSIVFNGRGRDAYETFGFPLAPFTADRPSFQFVKTGQNPYDEVVVACLFVAKDHFPYDILEISSDGSAAEWAAGARLYAEVLGRKPKESLREPEQERQRELDAERGRELLLGADAKRRVVIQDEYDDPQEEQPKHWTKDRRFVGAVVLTCLVIIYLLARRGRR
jgi:hypothetical protein